MSTTTAMKMDSKKKLHKKNNMRLLAGHMYTGTIIMVRENILLKLEYLGGLKG